jgi:predicted DCC family thiol-disulfide oxidoreductase YuxK
MSLVAAVVSTRIVSAPRTAAPGGARLIALFDGHCVFCTRQAKQLERLVGANRVELVSFQDEGVLGRFPGVSHEACMQRMHVVQPDGRVFAGAEAVARAALLLPVIGWIAFLYYVPGVRQLAEWGYGVVARERYRIAGKKSGEGEGCAGGTCSLHK